MECERVTLLAQQICTAVTGSVATVRSLSNDSCNSMQINMTANFDVFRLGLYLNYQSARI
jgi:hypothetical protein